MEYSLGIFFVIAACAQTYEVGADIGYGIYQDAPHNTARGVFQQYTPLFRLSYTF